MTFPPPLDPDVADLAPSGPLLTAYDEEHAITYMRMLDADAEGLTGARCRGSYCTLTRQGSLSERGGSSTAIWLAPNG